MNQGDKVVVHFRGRQYVATVLEVHRKTVKIRFRLKNGRDLERRALVLERGQPVPRGPNALIAYRLSEDNQHGARPDG